MSNNTNDTSDWRKNIIRPTLGLQVGGFRPTSNLTASCFGEIRAEMEGEMWPEYKDKPLWPLCQLNLSEASYQSDLLADIVLITVFIAQDYMMMAGNVIETTDQEPYSGWFLRTYTSLDKLIPVTNTKHRSPLQPFEAQWDSSTSDDYPTHDTLPIDFNALGIGDFYKQDGVVTLNRTKIGGWPSCINLNHFGIIDPNALNSNMLFKLIAKKNAVGCGEIVDLDTLRVARKTLIAGLWIFSFTR